MTLTEFLKRTNYALRGVEDDVPTVGDEDATFWVTTFNRKKDEMYDDVTKNWSSAYDDKVVGTIEVSVAPSFDLDASDEANDLSNFLGAADEAYVIDTDGQYHYFDVVKVNEIDRRIQQVYTSGQNPVKLRFTKPITDDDSIVGGTLHLPGYWRPADIDPDGEDSQVIPVDDANWAVMATAAQVAFNDITYEDKFDDLDGQAAVLWRNMIKRNRRRNRGNAEVTPVRVPRIRGVR